MAEGGKKYSLFVVVGFVVFGLLLAGGISYFIASKIVSDRFTGNRAAAQREPGVFIKLGDPKEGLIVNVGGLNSGRYLKIGIVLELRADKKTLSKEAGKMSSPEEIKILDTVVQLLRSQKIEDLEPSKQEALKELIKTEVNKALGSDEVLEVYITNFILQ